MARIIREQQREQVSAVHVLIEGGEFYLDSVLSLLESDHFMVWSCAGEILGKIASPKVRKALEQLRKAPEKGLRERAARILEETVSDRDTAVHNRRSDAENTLYSNNKADRIRAVRLLQKEQPDFLDRLQQEIRTEKKPGRRKMLIAKLAALRDKRALETLMQYTQNREQNTRNWSTEGVIALEDPDTTDWLGGFIGDRDGRKWFRAARALYRMGDPRGIEGLVSYLRRAVPILIIRDLERDTAEKFIREFYTHAEQTPPGLKEKPASVHKEEALRRDVHNAWNWSRYDGEQATRLLAESGDGRIIEILKYAVDRGGASTFRNLLLVLDNHPHVPAIMCFIRDCTQAQNIDIRRMATEQLAVKWEADEPSLYLEFLEDPDAALRKYAAYGLLLLGNRDKIEAVFCNLPVNITFEEENVRDYIKGHEYVLMRLLDSPDEDFCSRAIQYLGIAGYTPAIPEMIRFLDGDSRRLETAAVNALERLGYQPF